jgi:radical SAM protein with 4Fe4S-binding SPASM domain
MTADWMKGILPGLRALRTREVEFPCDRIPYKFENVSLKKILNWLLVEASVRFRRRRPWGMPTILQVEPTNRCNLRCTLCPVAEGLTRESGFMDPALFRRIVDEAAPSVFLMLLWEWGEPFIHPEIYSLIAYARSKGIQLVSSSNGHIFTHGDHAENVVRSGLNSLIVAVDGISQDTYTRYRRDGNLEVVLEGIRSVVAKKRELHSATPLINLRFIVMKHNEHEIPRLHALAESLGVDVYTLKTLYPGHDVDPAEDKNNDFIPANPEYRRFRYTNDFMRIRQAQNPCTHLWRSPAVHWNGVVCPCSFDVEAHYPFGDLKQSTLREVWFGQAYSDIRRRFREKWESIPACDRCSYAYLGGDCSRDTIIKSVFMNPTT